MRTLIPRAPLHKNTVGRSRWTIARGRPSGQLRGCAGRSPRADPPNGRRQSVHRVRLRKPKRLPFLLAKVSRTDGQPAYVCCGCHRWSRCVGPAGARRACRGLDGLSDRGGVSIEDPSTDTSARPDRLRAFDRWLTRSDIEKQNGQLWRSRYADCLARARFHQVQPGLGDRVDLSSTAELVRPQRPGGGVAS
jgi:hypothetical protein